MKQESIKQNQVACLFQTNINSLEREFVVHENARLTYFFLCTSSADINITVKLVGPRAHARIFGLYLLSDAQQVNIITRQEHSAPHAQSQVLVKGILSGQAQSKYEGSIFIAQQAIKSVASQHNKNILLSPHAHAWAQPSLEVLTNDVQCAHGSASGQLNADQLLYLQTRGLCANMAKKLLLQGFFADILNKVGNQEAQKTVSEKLGLLIR